jgi:hypothetical protein
MDKSPLETHPKPGDYISFHFYTTSGCHSFNGIIRAQLGAGEMLQSLSSRTNLIFDSALEQKMYDLTAGDSLYVDAPLQPVPSSTPQQGSQKM